MAHELLILDACVLIDFLAADETVIAAIAGHVGTVHVAPQVLAEVGGLDAVRATELGMQVVEPSLELVRQAAAVRGRLSFPDHVCLLLAVERGWTCVTNDAALRRVCESDGVPVLWGLELLAMLVEAGGLPVEAVLEVAEGIAAANPYIKADTMMRFRARVEAAKPTRR